MTPLLNKLLAGFDRRTRHNRLALNIAAADLLRREILQQGVSRKDIAEKLNVSPARISQILNIEDGNPTLNTLADIATALDKRFCLTLRPDPHAAPQHKALLVSVSETLPESGSTATPHFKPFHTGATVYES